MSCLVCERLAMHTNGEEDSLVTQPISTVADQAGAELEQQALSYS
jgi:hypothetical protein